MTRRQVNRICQPVMSTCQPSNIGAYLPLRTTGHGIWSSNGRAQRPCFDQGREKVIQTFSLHEDLSFPRPLSRANIVDEFRFSRITHHIKPGFSRFSGVVGGMSECMLGGLRHFSVVFRLTPPSGEYYCETARWTEVGIRTHTLLGRDGIWFLTEKPRKSLEGGASILSIWLHGSSIVLISHSRLLYIRLLSIMVSGHHDLVRSHSGRTVLSIYR